MYQELRVFGCVFWFFLYEKRYYTLLAHGHLITFLSSKISNVVTLIWKFNIMYPCNLIGFYHSTIASLLSQQLPVFFIQCSCLPEIAKLKFPSFQLASLNLFSFGSFCCGPYSREVLIQVPTIQGQII